MSVSFSIFTLHFLFHVLVHRDVISHPFTGVVVYTTRRALNHDWKSISLGVPFHAWRVQISVVCTDASSFLFLSWNIVFRSVTGTSNVWRVSNSITLTHRFRKELHIQWNVTHNITHINSSNVNLWDLIL
jgi:hypothetical protein